MRESPPEKIDDTLRLPTRRPIIWEQAADLQKVLTLFVVLIFALTLCCMFLVHTVIKLSMREPAVLQDDLGYVSYRTTEVYKLRKDIIMSFSRELLDTLLTVTPGRYNNLVLRNRVDLKVLDVFSKSAYEAGEQRLTANDRQNFELYDVKRYVDNEYPDLIAIACRGEKQVYREQSDAAGNVRPHFETDLMALVLYLQQRVPTPENPWGLFVVGVKLPEFPKQSEAIWQQTADLETTLDTKGKPIGSGRKAGSQ
jgi:hypothetical protein